MHARLIYPHQLFRAHFDADDSTLMVLVEDDLFFRQLPFHRQKLVLHRSSMRAFADELRSRDFAVDSVETSADATTHDQLAALLRRRRVTVAGYYDVVDDWLEQRVSAALSAVGVRRERMESPGFLTTRTDLRKYFANRPRRMSQFYAWQRRRLDILVEGDQPVGGRWSFDADNRRKAPADLVVPAAPHSDPSAHTAEAMEWVQAAFPDNPGRIDGFAWPTERAQAAAWLTSFLEQRLENFGPYEDAMVEAEPVLFHSQLSPLLNIGLLDPSDVVRAALTHADDNDIPLPSIEGFIRQVIGWREYMRATYLIFGRSMRSRNALALSRSLPPGWWSGTTGLGPVDTVIGRVEHTAYAHHIERLMVLGNAMLLLRVDPDEVYRWFMTVFIDAYDWVMVPNVYAMSQFAAGELITTKPYVSASSYLRRMSDFPGGDWCAAWDALYWQFVSDYRDMFLDNRRSAMMVRQYDRFDAAKKERLRVEARRWLEG
ncbi:MAG: cryptochrome/photolyase family protein [Nocardioidaceae bacterium]